LSKLDKRNPLAIAVRTALLATTAMTVSMPSAVYAEEAAEDDDSNKVVITGSRIKRSEAAGALPVTVITRSQIEMSGESSAADLLRNTTFNSAGSFRPQSGSSAQGVAQLNLRGIGAGRTLILVDGRRLPKSPSTGSSQDLNAIPLGAIERIEILTDGASAVYGSDALGGVVNIITRDDFDGAQMMLGAQSVSLPADGGDREEGSILFGTTSAKGKILGGVSWNSRDIIFARDFYFNSGGASVFGNSYSTFTNGVDDRNWTTIPDGNGGVACDFPGTAFFSTPNTNAVNGGERCAYDFTQVSADEASTSNRSLWVKGEREINSDWSVWANASISQSNSFGRYAPVPDRGIMSGASPNNPSNPAGNVYDAVAFPGGAEDTTWWHRFDALGNRDSTVDNKLEDLQLGFTGVVNGDIDLDIGIRNTSNRTSDIGRNYLLRSAAAAHIESGAYDLSDPYSADAAILNSMKVTISRISKYDQNEFWANGTFELFEMDGGAAQIAAGVEYREEFYEDLYDSLSEAGQVGGSAGNSAGGDRDAKAAFVELYFPVTEELEVSFAGRYDSYSDYGSDFSPKLSVSYRPTDELLIRGSYGEGFLAPSLDILTQLDSFSADTISDTPTCQAQGQPDDCRLQVDATVTANPNLSSETSKQFSAGIVYEPNDWSNYSLDFWDINIQNRIRSFTSQFLINAARRGDAVPSGLGVTLNPNDNSIVAVVRGFGNQGDVDLSGFDFNGRFNFDIAGGDLSSNVQLSYILETTVDGGRELIEDPGAPAARMTIQNAYTIGDFSFGYNFNLISDQYDEVDVTETNAAGVSTAADRSGHVPTWITHDFQVNYNTTWDGRFTVGVQNAGEKRPPVGLGNVGSRDYDFTLYHAYGRIAYVRYTQNF
jgi:iron complex outermembrane recepter protein